MTVPLLLFPLSNPPSLLTLITSVGSNLVSVSTLASTDYFQHGSCWIWLCHSSAQTSDGWFSLFKSKLSTLRKCKYVIFKTLACVRIMRGIVEMQIPGPLPINFKSSDLTCFPYSILWTTLSYKAGETKKYFTNKSVVAFYKRNC